MSTPARTTRIEPIEMASADGKAKELLDELAARGGEPGTMVRAMANAPALLKGYLDLNRAMKRSHLDRRISERIAEVVGLVSLQLLTGAFNLTAGIHPPVVASAA